MELFFLRISFIFLPYILSSAIDSKDFYRIFASGNLSEVNTCLKKLASEESTSLLNAYTGAMLMRKASLEKVPKAKLESFKAGHKLLETEISRFPDNIEFRFLRLVIQEKAPEILKYNKNLKEDKEMIIQGFQKLEINLQNQVKQFSNHSRVLTIKDLQ
jgi:hypothetical protein